jgi:phosphoribosylanthranilate isomerase
VRPVVKICCIASVAEARLALAHGAAALGLVSAVLLDSGDPRAPVKRLGGTGRTHDWAVSRRIRDALAARQTPVYLAGGLRAGNVRAAMAQVMPHGLDLCSSVRRDGRLGAALLAAFFQALATDC